jgi:hypothetical protein
MISADRRQSGDNYRAVYPGITIICVTDNLLFRSGNGHEKINIMVVREIRIETHTDQSALAACVNGLRRKWRGHDGAILHNPCFGRLNAGKSAFANDEKPAGAIGRPIDAGDAADIGARNVDGFRKVHRINYRSLRVGAESREDGNGRKQRGSHQSRLRLHDVGANPPPHNDQQRHSFPCRYC